MKFQLFQASQMPRSLQLFFFCFSMFKIKTKRKRWVEVKNARALPLSFSILPMIKAMALTPACLISGSSVGTTFSSSLSIFFPSNNEQTRELKLSDTELISKTRRKKSFTLTYWLFSL
jgi:hypothetical protein